MLSRQHLSALGQLMDGPSEAGIETSQGAYVCVYAAFVDSTNSLLLAPVVPPGLSPTICVFNTLFVEISAALCCAPTHGRVFGITQIDQHLEGFETDIRFDVAY